MKKVSSTSFHSRNHRIQLMSKNHIDPILALAKFQDGKEDPGASAMTETAKANGDFFAENSTVAVPLPMTTALSENMH